MKEFLSFNSLSIVLLAVFGSFPLSECSFDSKGCPRNLPHTTHMAVFKTTCYQFVSEEKFWHQARDHCLRNGGRLVKIDDPQTNEFIVEKLNGLWWRNNAVWIGLHDISSEMRWQWTGFELYRNEPVLWTNWGRGHPGAFLHSHRDCVRMVRSDGWRWHETFCNSMKWHYRFICEYNANNTARVMAMNERILRGQSSRNKQHSIENANMMEHVNSESISRDSKPQAAAAVQSDEEKASNEVEHNKTVIVIAVVGVLIGAVAFGALFMFYRSRKRRQSELQGRPVENCVGSKGKKFDDVMTEASSFRPHAVSNVYVEADVMGHVTTRLAAEPPEIEPEDDGSDDETVTDRSREDSVTKKECHDEDMIDTGYDTPKAINIYSEIPEENPENSHIYEALEDVRK